MSYEPFNLEDTLDPWLEAEGDFFRRRAVIQFLMDLCDREGHAERAAPVENQALPSFAVLIPGTAVVVVWVVVARYRQVVLRYVYDLETGDRYPP